MKNQIDNPISKVNDLANTSRWTGIWSLLPYLFLGIMFYLDAKRRAPSEFGELAFAVVPICFGVGIVLGLVSLITGILAIRQIKKNENIETGNRAATIGMVLGILGIIANILFCEFFVLAMTRD